MAEDQDVQAAKPQLSDAELRTLAYFAIGVASEGSIGPKSVAYQLSFAGTIKDGVMTPAQGSNSGFSIGTLQTDLGQHPEVATQMVAAYQTWAAKQTPSVAFSTDDEAQVTSDLQRNGKAIRADKGRPMDETARSNLNKFLASDDGIAFIHERDKSQIDVLMHAGDGKKDSGGAMYQLQQTDLYKNATLDDQAKLATMVMKLENQAGTSRYPGVIDGINNGTLKSADDVKTNIDGMMANKNGQADYIESGVDHALQGTEVFNKLRAAKDGNPLHDAFQAVCADPLKSPVDLKNDAANQDPKHQYDAIRTLFLQNGQAPKLIAALDQDDSFGYDVKNAKGKVSAQSSSLFGADDDVVVFDGRGHGTAFVGGKWSSVERDDVKRVGKDDRSVDLQVTKDGKTETLLHVPTLEQMQEKRKAAAQPDASAPANPIAPEQPQAPTRDGRAANDDPLLQQARAAVARLDGSLGRNYDDASERMSASLAVLARQQGLDRIDHVALNRQADGLRAGENVYVVQGRLDDPGHLRAQMPTATAAATPVTESLARLDALERQAPMQQRDALEQEQVQRQARSV